MTSTTLGSPQITRGSAPKTGDAALGSRLRLWASGKAYGWSSSDAISLCRPLVSSANPASTGLLDRRR